MKKYSFHRALLFSAVAMVTNVHAQFPSFPDSNAVWRMDMYDGPNFISSFAYHLEQSDHDTLIDESWFSVLRYGFEGQGGGIAGGLQDNGNGKVYFHHANTDSTYLLYDFTLAPGDSTVVWSGDAVFTTPRTEWMYIETVETLLTNGIEYVKVGVRDANAIMGGQGVSNWWIQGVGGSGGLLDTPGSSTVSVYSTLGCMSHNDTLWPGGTPGNCLTTSISEFSTSNIQVHPNPSTGLFSLSLTNRHEQIFIFDSQGRELLRTHDRDFDLSSHPPGIYTAVVTTAQGRQAVRLVLVR